jgi:spore coat protein U-like protein
MKKFLLAASLAGLSTMAQPASQSTSFTVSASVVSSCAVSAGDLDFGDYDPLSATPVASTATVNVQCSLLAPFNIGLDAGINGGGTVTTRAMKITGGGTDTLSYSLTRDLAHLLNWGTTIGTNTLAGVGTGLSVGSTIYGLISAGQNKSVGDYSDTITVTVTY